MLVLDAGSLADACEVELVVTGGKLSVLLTARCLESQPAEVVDGTDRLVLVFFIVKSTWPSVAAFRSLVTSAIFSKTEH